MNSRKITCLAAILSAALPLAPLFAQQAPEDVYYQAYKDFQNSESLEQKGDIDGAVTRLRSAESILKQLSKQSPDWKAVIVEYRLRKIRESLDRLESQVTLRGTGGGEDYLEGPLPQQGGGNAPRGSGPSVYTSPNMPIRPVRKTAPQSYGNYGGGSMQDKEVLALRRQVRSLSDKLRLSEAEVQSAQVEKDKVKGDVVELKSKVQQLEQQLSNAAEDGNESRQLKDTLAKTKQQLEAAEADRAVLEEENTSLMDKLGKAADYIAKSDLIRQGLEKDRKDLSAAIEGKGLPNPSEMIQLRAENTQLQIKVTDAEAKLAESEAKLAGTISEVKDLTRQLDVANAEIDRMKLNPNPGAEEKNMIAENEMLRGIVLRQLADQAKREDARKIVENELKKLDIKSSDVLAEQTQVLTAPTVALSQEEKRLFQDPMMLMSEPKTSSMDVKIGMSLPSKRSHAVEKAAGANDEIAEDLKPKVEDAKALYSKQDYTGAAKLYRDIAAKAPGSHFVQTNLGIVELQLGQMPEAENALNKAVDLKPNDAVAYAYLGIVRDRQGKTDDAMKFLQKSLEIDSASHVAHNYLGICFGKKGNRERAEKEIKEAITLKPDYAAAHFNLAILYATSKPPAMDLAKEYYSKAIELGAAPDASLEKLITKS
jgi:Flp pilus assembly protein TadD